MIKISENYERKGPMVSYMVFDLMFDRPEEIINFFKENGEHLDKRLVNANDLEKKIVTLRSVYREQAQMRINRFNLILKGDKLQSDKQEYLEYFKSDAIRAIIYGTLFCPKQLSIGEYTGMVISTFERFGDTTLFGNRILEICQCSNPREYAIVCQQIDLFINLLSAPWEHLDDNEEEVD